MSLKRVSGHILLVVILAVSALATAAGASPRLEVVESARVGQWTKVKAKLVAEKADEVEFAPKDVFIELTDGSRASKWRWESFFPEASADLNKGDRITSEGTKIDGKLVSLSYFNLVEGSTATIKVPLAAGKPQEAILYFETRPGAKASRLVMGKLAPAKLR
jgi:hypothetical protein